jgi:transcription initiation factor IIE alpha subunit
MAIDVNFNKEYYDKRTYEKTIDTAFTQLGVKTIQEQLDEQPSVQEFFSLYNDLFYQIPELGDTNSHEFLVKTSGDYIAFDENNELIEALQNEIASLREELLTTQQELANQSTQT